LEDYSIHESNISILCDNTTVKNLAKHHVLHFKTKHIEIKHHFIIDYVQKGIFDLQFIPNKWSTDERFSHLRTLLDMTL